MSTVGGRAWIESSPLIGADRETRVRVLAAIRTGDHLTGPEEKIALGVARQWARLPWVQLALTPLLAIAAILQAVSGNLLVSGLLTLAWAGVLYLQQRNRRRGELYLDAAGIDPDAPGPGSSG